MHLDHEPSPWLLAHEKLTRLAKQRAAADSEEGRCLLDAWRTAAHAHMGYASFGEYVERIFGYSRRNTQEKLRVAEALEHLPAAACALEEGTVSWSVVRELTRVAVPETEHVWLEAARGKTVRQLEELVAGKTPGARPDAPADPSLRRHVLRYEVSPDTFAVFREALAELRRRAEQTLSEDEALLEMARHALAPSRDDGRASYQIAIDVCAECGQASQPANGAPVPVAAHILEMADCDAQHLGKPQPANDAAHAHVGARAKQSIPPKVRRSVLRRDQRRCRVAGCQNATFVDIHHIKPRAVRGTNHPNNFITLCGAHHRALHRGDLIAKRTENGGVQFHHADGTAYGHFQHPKSSDQISVAHFRDAPALHVNTRPGVLGSAARAGRPQARPSAARGRNVTVQPNPSGQEERGW
jgi:hypothetical protein